MSILKNWIYIGVFLDEETKNQLKALTKKTLDDNWKLYCHHMTIAFNDGSDKAVSLYHIYKEYFGAKTEITATHIGVSKDAIALKVDFKGQIMNKIPHVTLATPIDGKPVNSNYITEWQPLIKPIKLTGIFSSFNK